MDKKEMLQHLRAVEQELVRLVEEEEKQQAEQQGQAPYWRFVYEQLMDTGEWCPNDQLIQAYDIGRAFATLGYVVREMGLKIRDIRYGPSSKMGEEMQIVRSFWDEQIKKKK